MTARFAADPNLVKQNDILINELMSYYFLNIFPANLDLML